MWVLGCNRCQRCVLGLLAELENYRQPAALPTEAPAPRRRLRRREGENDAELAQKLGQRQPFVAVFPQECMGQLAPFGPT